MTLLIKPILCRAGMMDNYAYIVTDSETSVSAVIDASEAAPIIAECEKNNITPEYIFTTHHHFDHVGGNTELKQKYRLKIVVPQAEQDLIEGADISLSDGEQFMLGKTRIIAVSAPGHTKGHLLYYIPEEKVIFTGDVLFNLCIGGLFEGTPSQMWESLQKIKNLPDDVSFYPGHEYTPHCLADVLKKHDSQPVQLYVQLAARRLNNHLPVAPIKLGLEKQCNPYLQIENKEKFERLF